jgi:predicted NBD/HSP70 family sugar kinase
MPSHTIRLLAHPDSTSDLSSVMLKDLKLKRKIMVLMSKSHEVSINEIAASLDISTPKAALLMNELTGEKLIKVVGKRTAGPGRKASLYALRHDNCFFLGVEIKKYKINVALMGFDKKILKSHLDIPFHYQEAGESLKEIVLIINNFLREVKVDRSLIAGLGVSVAGRINVRTGEILTIYHFSDAPIKAILEQELQMPVYLDNDSRTIAYGEYFFGNRKQEKEVLIMNLDYGMGIGIFVNGRPVYGASGYAGELSHIPLFNNEIICFCGKKGCLETEVSGNALIKKVIELINSGSNSILKKVLNKKGFLELEDVLLAVEKGDNLTLQAIGIIAGKLGRGLAITINIFNPQLIIIGGALSAIGEPLLLPLKASIIQHSLNLVNADTQVVLSSLHFRAGLLGCCLLVRDKMLGILQV